MWQAIPHHTAIHHQVLHYQVSSWSLPYGYSPSSAVLSCDGLIPTIWWFTIKRSTFMWQTDPHYMVIHHQVHTIMWIADPSPYGDSPSSALLSCDKLIPTIWWFTIKFSMFMWLTDPYNMVIHHQVLYYDMSAWSTLYHNSLSSTVLSWPNAFFCENVCSKLGTNFPLFLIIIKHLMIYLLVNV